MVWTAVRPMFSLPRPSPVTKCAFEHLVVVGERVVIVADAGIGVGSLAGHRRSPVMIVVDQAWRRVMGNVVEEGMAGAHRAHRFRADRSERIAFDHDVIVGIEDVVAADADDDLGIAVRAGNELAVRVGTQFRHVVHVEIGQRDAEHARRLRLHLAPVGDAAVLRR